MCTIELKGPALDLSGLTAFDIEKIEKKTKSIKQEEVGNTHNYATTAPEFPCTGNEDFYCEGFSDGKVFDQFNYMFSDIDFWYGRNAIHGSIRNALRPVAQTVCQALLSTTGCAFLYNHQSAIAVRVDRRETDGRIAVQTTGTMRCDSEPGNVAALVCFAKHCLDEVRGKDKCEMQARVRELSAIIAEAATINATKHQASQQSGSGMSGGDGDNGSGGSGGGGDKSGGGEPSGGEATKGSGRCRREG